MIDVEELLGIKTTLFPRFAVLRLQLIPHLGKTAVDLGLSKAADRAKHLDIGGDQLPHPLPILSLARLDEIPHELDVLFRHARKYLDLAREEVPDS